MKKSLSLFIIAFIALTSSINANAWTDRNTFGLKGPVEAVYKDGSDYASMEFDEYGYLIAFDDCKITRYKNNRIESYGTWISYHTYYYNKKGQVSKTIHVCETVPITTTYTYNTKGHVIKSITKYPPKYEVKTSIITFTYQKFDKYGNWTKRTFKEGKDSYVETRTITYYE